MFSESIPRNLHCIINGIQLEDGTGTMNGVKEHDYLGETLTNVGNYEEEINKRINNGRAALSKLKKRFMGSECGSQHKGSNALVKSTLHMQQIQI